MYAVVDVETTGLYPGGHDRVIELAVIQVDANGAPESTWESLFNPGRDLGPQYIHRVNSADILHAPRFEDLAGTVLNLLRDRVLVGHNVFFDQRFLQAEIDRLGWSIDIKSVPAVDTLRWSSEYLKFRGPLDATCARAGLAVRPDHRALSDAEATAVLFAALLERTGGNPPWPTAAKHSWPLMASGTKLPVTRNTVRMRSESPLADYPSELDEPVSDERQSAYEEQVDRALIDGIVSEREVEALRLSAWTNGIDRTHAYAIHRARLRAFAAATLAPLKPTVTAAALQLGLTIKEITLEVDPAKDPNFVPYRVQLAQGDRIVLTGAMSQPRETWIDRLEAAGLVAQDAVTRQTSLVVAADPDSLSAKARKAEGLGIPIVTESAFASLLRDVIPEGAESSSPFDRHLGRLT